MDAQIDKENISFSFEEQGIITDDFDVSSLPLQTNYGNIEGTDGTIDYGATYGQRTINMPFRFESADSLDYPLFRDFIFGLILDKSPFYIRERRRLSHQSYGFETPGQEMIIPEDYKNKFISGKRYKVRLQNTFNLDQMRKRGKGEFTFETTDLPFAESIGTTQDIQDNGISSDSELWGIGMGLITDEDSLIYTHTSNSFRIYNAGNEPVHPFQQDLKITISEVVGSTSFLELKNNTNGSTFKVNEAVTGSQTIVLDGPNITSNGLAFLRSTNKGFIELEPGWNDFTISGSTSAKTAFDFRFYYR